jgi:hypothetical protein
MRRHVTRRQVSANVHVTRVYCTQTDSVTSAPIPEDLPRTRVGCAPAAGGVRISSNTTGTNAYGWCEAAG